MEFSAAVELLREVFVDLTGADAAAVTSCLRASQRLRSGLDARDSELHLLLEGLSSYPEKIIADASKTTVKAAEKKMKRALPQRRTQRCVTRYPTERSPVSMSIPTVEPSVT
jgi:hypothetical protein